MTWCKKGSATTASRAAAVGGDATAVRLREDGGTPATEGAGVATEELRMDLPCKASCTTPGAASLAVASHFACRFVRRAHFAVL